MSRHPPLFCVRTLLEAALTLLLALLLLACDQPVDTGSVPVDADGDGVLSTEDCDDSDAAVSPLRSELCDGFDNDCDGLTDEIGALEEPTWYPDEDSDGYGDLHLGQTSCEGPAGWMDVGGDCDDSDAAVNPGAPDPCNGVDDDCDGVVDGGSGGTWFRDADADGFGGGAGSVACDAPVGWVADDTDCDDTDGDVHPGAAELCNSIDDDCDGTADETGCECENGQLDAGEEGVDCGGSCEACPLVELSDTDALSGLARVGDQAYALASDRLYRIDLGTGQWSFFRLLAPCTDAAELVSASGQLTLRCASEGTWRIDPSSGVFSPLSGPSDPGPGAVTEHAGLVDDGAGAVYVSLLSSAAEPLAIVHIDVATGERSTLSDALTGTGPLPSGASGAALGLLPDGDLIWLGDGDGVRVDPSTGDRSALVLSGAVAPGGVPAALTPAGGDSFWLAYDSVLAELAGTDVVVDASLRRLDLVSASDGVLSNVSGVSGSRALPVWSGTGTLPVRPVALAADSDGSILLADANLPGVLEVDPSSGERAALAATRAGSGWALAEPDVLTLGDDGLLYVSDFALGATRSHHTVFVVDPSTGDRSALSSNLLGAGPFFLLEQEQPEAMVQAGTDPLIVALTGGGVQRAFEIDVITGDRAELTGTPPSFDDPTVALTASGSTCTVTVGGAEIICDDGTGAVVLSGAGVGSGPTLRDLGAIVALPDSRLVVTDRHLGALLAVDPVSGDRSLLSGLVVNE